MADTLSKVTEATGVFTRRGWTYELIVCDNNSTDRTSEIARMAGAVVVFESINQISRARNRGAAIAKGDWLLFIDADSHPSSELFQEMCTAIASGRYLGGGALVRIDTTRWIARFFNGLWNFVSRVGTFMAGSFIFVERDAFRQLRGFSEQLFAGEELEFAQRLKEIARERKKQLVILKSNPLQTSARKVELYSVRELAWFFTRALFAQDRVLQSRDACHPWYDGRR